MDELVRDSVVVNFATTAADWKGGINFRNNPETDNPIKEHLKTERRNKWMS